jgi:hypothetical protein
VSFHKKGGDYMVKKAAVATGVFAMSALAAATMAFAQTPTTSTNNTTTNSTTNSTANTTTNTTVPAGAPATGHGA